MREDPKADQDTGREDAPLREEDVLREDALDDRVEEGDELPEQG